MKSWDRTILTLFRVSNLLRLVCCARLIRDKRFVTSVSNVWQHGWWHLSCILARINYSSKFLCGLQLNGAELPNSQKYHMPLRLGTFLGGHTSTMLVLRPIHELSDFLMSSMIRHQIDRCRRQAQAEGRTLSLIIIIGVKVVMEAFFILVSQKKSRKTA